MITVANKYKPIGLGVYIGRPTPLGNKYVIGKDGTRDEVIAKYEIWLRAELSNGGSVREEFDRLAALHTRKGNLTLYCWCAPQRCHGDVIKELIENEPFI